MNRLYIYNPIAQDIVQVWANFLDWQYEYNGRSHGVNDPLGMTWRELTAHLLIQYGAVYVNGNAAGQTHLKFNNSAERMAFILRFS